MVTGQNHASRSAPQNLSFIDGQRPFVLWRSGSSLCHSRILPPFSIAAHSIWSNKMTSDS
jgi:hypothetical protein